jgi:dihydrofolate synthase/folylpolyglutamate synthase
VSAVGLDHTQLLGDSVDAIATHKAGIVGEGNIVVVVDQDDVVLDVVRERVREVGGELLVATPPPGAHYQERNLALARAAVGVLARRDRFVMPNVDVTETPPGRYERFVSNGRRLVLDGAHNPQKVEALVDALRGDGVTSMAVLATLLQAPETKLAATLSLLAPLVTHLIVPEYALGDGDKMKVSFPADVVVEQARALGINAEVVRNPSAGLSLLMDRPEQTLVVTGSLYLASLVRPLVLAHWGDPVPSF